MSLQQRLGWTRRGPRAGTGGWGAPQVWGSPDWEHQGVRGRGKRKRETTALSLGWASTRLRAASDTPKWRVHWSKRLCRGVSNILPEAVWVVVLLPEILSKDEYYEHPYIMIWIDVQGAKCHPFQTREDLCGCTGLHVHVQSHSHRQLLLDLGDAQWQGWGGWTQKRSMQPSPHG